MGLLDSNKVKLQNASNVLATNVAPDAATKTWTIKCKGYKVLALWVKSANGASTFTFKKKLSTSDNTEWVAFNVYSQGKLFANRNVNIPQATGTFIYIDVSDCDSLTVAKTDSVATTSIWYSFSQLPISNLDYLSEIIKGVLSTSLNVESMAKIKADINKVITTTSTTEATNFTAVDCQGYKTMIITITGTAGSEFQIVRTRNGQNSSYLKDGSIGVLDVGDAFNYYMMDGNTYCNIKTKSTTTVLFVDCDGCTNVQVKKIDSSVAISAIRYSLTQHPFEKAEEFYEGWTISGTTVVTKNITRRSGMRTLRIVVNTNTIPFSFTFSSQKPFTKVIPVYVEDRSTGTVSKYAVSQNIVQTLAKGYYNLYIDINSIYYLSFRKPADIDSNAEVEFIQSPEDFSSSLQKKIDSIDSSRLTILNDLKNYTIKSYSPSMNGGMILGAVWQNLAVWYTADALYISTNGLEGDVTKVDFVSSENNFPGLIADSTIKRVMIVPYDRIGLTTDTVTYGGEDARIVVFTNKCQIYHNNPSTIDGADGSGVANGMYKFDESVVWDLPDRINPVKTNSGDDAALIATGKYKYMPCLPDHMYEMHPAINQTSPFGNHGFGATRTYTDSITGQQETRARFFVPIRDFYEGDAFNWLSGCIQDTQMSAIGTYISAYTYMGRVVVFSTNNGREWFALKEYGAHGEIIVETGDGDIPIQGPWSDFAEYGDAATNRIRFGTNSMDDSSAFVLKKRSQYSPNDYQKDPEVTRDGHTGHRFKYGSAVAISNIASSTADGIIVTTSANHGLVNGDIIVIEKNGSGNASWNWLCADGHDELQSGNGTIWKIQRLTDTTFRLMLEVENPNENLTVRHVHSLNYSKDGLIVSCGEEYPNGWIELIYKPIHDTFSNSFAGNHYPVYRLTSSAKSAQRTLGCELVDEGIDKMFYIGADTDIVKRDSNVLPEGRQINFTSSSFGVYKGKLENIDDYDKFECILPVNEPAYFFKIVQDIMVFCGQQGTVALSNDMGKSWTTIRVPSSLYSNSWLIGVTNSKEICIRYYGTGSHDALIIKSKV